MVTNRGIKYLLFMASLLFAIQSFASNLSIKTHKVYSGSEGLEVSIIELAAPANSFLVEVRNSGTDLDNKIIMHTKKMHDGGRRYSLDTKYNKKDFSTIYTSSGYAGDQLYFQNPTNYRKEFPLHYDIKATKKANPKDLVKKYSAAEKK